MIQKLLALLLSVILALTGGVPSDLLPADTASEGSDDLAVKTRPGDDGDARALDVAWTKVEGEAVEEDRWGVGSIDRIAFKVGVHAEPDATVAFGSEPVEVSPTDVLVVEDFEGRFEFQDVGKPSETLLLDGSVQRTSIDANDASRVTTEAASEAGANQAPPEAENATEVQHVVIGNDPVDGVAVARGPADRIATQSSNRPEVVDLRANWVRVDGETVDSYLSGQGTLDQVTFQVAHYAEQRYPTLNVSGEPTTLTPGFKVRVQDFTGSYLLYQNDDGQSRVKLDGVATQVRTPQSDTPADRGEEPVVRYEYVPSEPATSDTISFADQSYDPDGDRNLVYRWTFGDGTTSVERNPRHSYDAPGTYPVTLEVTDDDLHTNSTTKFVAVNNTNPDADFEWHPTQPTDVQEVQFSSQAEDPDGTVEAHHWDFDDGTTDTGRSVGHVFPDDGTYEVTLTAEDDAGGSSSVTRVVDVQNVAPNVSFSWEPSQPLSLNPVNFTSTTTDPDGTVESLAWDFDDGGSATGETPTHHFQGSGSYNVTLTATDDDGDSASLTRTVDVRNRPPEAGFTVATDEPVTGSPADFRENATDRDGSIEDYEWSFGDGNSTHGPNPDHAYGAAGTYQVTLTVTDDEGATDSVSEPVTIFNAPPTVDFVWNPTEPYDQTEVSFTDLTVDADGPGDLISWFWTFGDGNHSTERNPVNVFPDDGTYNVSLSVEDDADHNVTVTQPVLVRNQPPVIDRIAFDPVNPSSRDNVTMTVDASDPDGEVVNSSFELPNGTVLDGPVANVTFPEGDHDITARVVDDDGAPAADTRVLQVKPAPPIANFTTDPSSPAAGQTTTFIDTTTVGDAPITDWKWNFDDGTGATVQNPNNTYTEPGVYDVKLRVSDGNDRGDVVTKEVVVTAPPTVDFTVEPSTPSVDQLTFFNASGTDPDGQIVNWTWTFEGDPDPAYGQNVTHRFPDSGSYEVQLVATDDQGATTSETKIVDVRNQAPDADFVHSPKDALVGTEITFEDRSEDPDGNVTQRVWSFGDGDQAVGETVNHTYDVSRIYTAQLEATDDEGATGFARKPVRVTNDHDVTIEVTVVYPDGQPLNLSDPRFETSFTVEATGLTVGPNGTRNTTETADGISRATFQAGEWAGGEPIRWRIDGEGIGDTGITIRPPAEAFLVERGPVVVSTPLEGVIDVDPGTEGPDLGGSGDASPRYTNPTEPVTGNVTLAWGTGAPVVSTTVDVEVFYDDVSTSPLVSPTDHTPILTMTVATGDDGRAPFTVPPTLSEERGLYAPGWYELRFQEFFRTNGQISQTSDAGHFLEDPAGVLGAASDPGTTTSELPGG